ncbi:hypothetical protein HNR63_002778 [Anoxybacillus kamchatkensis]|nr:hypothetical protein [Anoxybacillus ayderensis]
MIQIIVSVLGIVGLVSAGFAYYYMEKQPKK